MRVRWKVGLCFRGRSQSLSGQRVAIANRCLELLRAEMDSQSLQYRLIDSQNSNSTMQIKINNKIHFQQLRILLEWCYSSWSSQSSCRAFPSARARGSCTCPSEGKSLCPCCCSVGSCGAHSSSVAVCWICCACWRPRSWSVLAAGPCRCRRSPAAGAAPFWTGWASATRLELRLWASLPPSACLWSGCQCSSQKRHLDRPNCLPLHSFSSYTLKTFSCGTTQRRPELRGSIPRSSRRTVMTLFPASVRSRYPWFDCSGGSGPQRRVAPGWSPLTWSAGACRLQMTFPLRLNVFSFLHLDKILLLVPHRAASVEHQGYSGVPYLHLLPMYVTKCLNHHHHRRCRSQRPRSPRLQFPCLLPFNCPIQEWYHLYMLPSRFLVAASTGNQTVQSRRSESWIHLTDPNCLAILWMPKSCYLHVSSSSSPSH